MRRKDNFNKKLDRFMGLRKEPELFEKMILHFLTAYGFPIFYATIAWLIAYQIMNLAKSSNEVINIVLISTSILIFVITFFGTLILIGLGKLKKG